ncbi:MAG: transcription factor S [Ignisphaera sp.]|nr:transcription factor S [Ignisphaera sp.]MCX8168440.1 transcription factor S [Ignisphaera sp.]MDW8085120.1 transcription factor S [Ignisphaera sp.]
MFCPACGSLMIFEKSRRGYRCPRCGYEMQNRDSGRAVVSKTIIHAEKERLMVVNSSIEVPPGSVLLKGHTRCPKCGYEDVYAWQLQTRAADEPPTTFYKCVKCGHTWREY